MKSFQDYVKEANVIHKNKYEYLKSYILDKYVYLTIKCKIHGIFEKRVGNHISKKQGCSYCSKPQKLTQEDFIKKANNIHNNLYDYSISKYEKGHSKIDIICKIHGKFNMLAINHLSGQGCPNCANNSPVNTLIFIKRANEIHNEKYDYTKVYYVNMYKPITIICKIHGEFLENPVNHLDTRTNQHCRKCSNRKVKNMDDFINQANIIHNNTYDYSKVEYEKSINKVIIICKIHNEFIQRPNDHLSGNGCPKCSNAGFSKICIEWLENTMKEQNIFIQHALNDGEYRLDIDNKIYYCDGFCKDTNTIYEFYGDFFHGNPNIYNKEDINKLTKKSFGELYDKTIERENVLKNQGYNLISIWENDYKN